MADTDGRPPAPDIFTALELEPGPSQRTPSRSLSAHRPLADEDSGETTAPVARQGAAPPAAFAVEQAAAPAQIPEPSVDLEGIGSAGPPEPAPVEPPPEPPVRGFGGLADLLEPELMAARENAAPDRPPTGAQPLASDSMNMPSAPLADPVVAARAAVPAVSAAPGPPAAAAAVGAGAPAAGLADPSLDPSLGIDIKDRGGRSMAWAWIAMTLMLAGAMFYILYTQTDLFEGNVIARRDAKAEADVEAEQKAVNEEFERNKKEYGTVTVNSEPEGARVWMVKPGPEATFENLPRGNTYQVFVDAPGHAPRVRLIKGSELDSPVTIDLDAAPNPDAFHPIPEGEKPKHDPAANPEDAGTLTLKSNTADSSLALLVGYTPGVMLIDLDARETHELRLTREGSEPHTIVIKGRHWEEAAGGDLVYMETVVLKEREEVLEIETEGTPEEGATPEGAEAGAGQPPPLPAETEPAEPKKKKKKKRRRKRRRKKKRRR